MNYTLPFSNKRFVIGAVIAALAFVLVILFFHNGKPHITPVLPQITINPSSGLES